MSDENSRKDPIDQPESLISWMVRFLKGTAIGIGAILPGLSGGVLAVIFGVYDAMIRFLANLTRKFWKNVMYFIPVGLGLIFGILLFSVVVDAAFGKYAAQFTCLFIGFVVGTFPSLYRQAGREGRNTKDLVTMAVAAVAIFALMYVGGSALLSVTPSIPVWIASGALIGLGMIVPGMSPSNFLIYFGLYDKMAAGIKNFDLGVILPLTVGLIICVLLFAKLVAWAFDRFYSVMYHLILGMVIGSSLAIFPTVVFPAFGTEGLAESGLSLVGAVTFAAVMLVLGVVFSYAFSLVEAKVEARREAIEALAKEETSE